MADPTKAHDFWARCAFPGAAAARGLAVGRSRLAPKPVPSRTAGPRVRPGPPAEEPHQLPVACLPGQRSSALKRGRFRTASPHSRGRSSPRPRGQGAASTAATRAPRIPASRGARAFRFPWRPRRVASRLTSKPAVTERRRGRPPADGPGASGYAGPSAPCRRTAPPDGLPQAVAVRAVAACGAFDLWHCVHILDTCTRFAARPASGNRHIAANREYVVCKSL